jgi:hypothetical protein
MLRAVRCPTFPASFSNTPFGLRTAVFSSFLSFVSFIQSSDFTSTFVQNFNPSNIFLPSSTFDHSEGYSIVLMTTWFSTSQQFERFTLPHDFASTSSEPYHAITPPTDSADFTSSMTPFVIPLRTLFPFPSEHTEPLPTNQSNGTVNVSIGLIFGVIAGVFVIILSVYFFHF